jgi:heme exporter protein B
MPQYIQHICAILRKDLASEFRTKESLPQMFIFALLMLVVWNVTAPLGTPSQDLLPGVLWMAFLFAGILELNHAFQTERENDCLQGLRLCPVARSALYFGKMVGNFLFMSVLELILVPIVVVLFNLPVGFYLYRLGVVLVLGTAGFVIIGTLLAAISMHTRIREMLLPLLVFPVVIPILIVAVKTTGSILAQQSLGEMANWLHFLGAFDVIFLGLAILLFEYVIESE